MVTRARETVAKEMVVAKKVLVARGLRIASKVAEEVLVAKEVRSTNPEGVRVTKEILIAKEICITGKTARVTIVTGEGGTHQVWRMSIGSAGWWSNTLSTLE